MLERQKKAAEDEIVHSQTWLGESTYYYDIHSGLASRNVNDIIDLKSLEFDPEGLNNYLQYGYSVFGQTPIKGIKYLRAGEVLRRNKDGRLYVTKKSDIFAGISEASIEPDDVWAKFDENLKKLAEENKGKFVVPTSGGFDSRLINYFLSKYADINAFSYGPTRKQINSFEVTRAREVCRRLNIPWRFVQLEDFNSRIPAWYELYGPATHAHGMYHLEFYSKIKRLTSSRHVVSGIYGDLWAGKIKTEAPSRPTDMLQLGLSHNLNVDVKFCLLPNNGRLLEEEFETEKEALHNERYRAVYLARTKAILLSYLLAVPENLGFVPSSPFLDSGLVKTMLSLPEKHWRDRHWQKAFIRDVGLDVHRVTDPGRMRNDLNYTSMKFSPLKPLNEEALSEIVDGAYVRWINSKTRNLSVFSDISNFLCGAPGLRRRISRLGIRQSSVVAYGAYLVLRPIEELLLRSKTAKGH